MQARAVAGIARVGRARDAVIAIDWAARNADPAGASLDAIAGVRVVAVAIDGARLSAGATGLTDDAELTVRAVRVVRCRRARSGQVIAALVRAGDPIIHAQHGSAGDAAARRQAAWVAALDAVAELAVAA
jgi:hypothetical protein